MISPTISPLSFVRESPLATATDDSLSDSPDIIGPSPPKTVRHSSSVRRLNFSDSSFVTSTPLPLSSGRVNPVQDKSRVPTRLLGMESHDSGICCASSSSGSSMELLLSELRKSNGHLKDLTNRMDSLDKRMKSLEDGSDADDEGCAHSDGTQKKQKKQKHAGPSKEIRVSYNSEFIRYHHLSSSTLICGHRIWSSALYIRMFSLTEFGEAYVCIIKGPSG